VKELFSFSFFTERHVILQDEKRLFKLVGSVIGLFPSHRVSKYWGSS